MHVAKIQKVLGIWKRRIGVGWRLVSCVNLEESFHSKITELRPSDPPLANLNIPRTPPPIPAGSAQVRCFCDITRVILGGEGMGHGVLIRTNFLRHDIVIVKKNILLHNYLCSEKLQTADRRRRWASFNNDYHMIK